MTKVLETTVIEIEGMLEGLRDKHNAWTEQQHKADTLLYVLLDGCLDFYRLLKEDEDCFAAFKQLGCVKWNKRTRVATMVIKAVFGAKAKKGYAYAKALEAAYTAEIGKANTATMTHWLNDNGGINGVIRKRGGTSAAQAAKAHAINVAKNARAYGAISKAGTFTCSFIDKEFSNAEELVLLCKYDKATKQMQIQWVTEAQVYIDDLYADAGECIMQQAVYRNNRLKVHKQLAVKQAKATAKVKAGLARITARVAEVEKEAKAA